MKIEDQITLIDTVKVLERIERSVNDTLSWLKIIGVASVLTLLAVAAATVLTLFRLNSLS